MCRNLYQQGIMRMLCDQRALSPVDYVGMVNYFKLKISFYTAKQFKAKKGLEAYNQLQMDEQFTNVPSSACIEM